tara:strand:+ start:72 stop:1352 length:1281 start_codon:yes stop_codon:yes gene_type:complete
MIVKYIYSACIQIETEDIKILCDPWFTEGIYDGSWYHFPEIKNPFKLIDKPDLIYISHIHPDHYDPNFLKKLFKKYGEIKVIIPNLKKNFLYFKSLSDGIKTNPTDYLRIKNTHIHIVPNMEGSNSDIDSALFVKDNNSSILNLNDCAWNRKQNLALKKIIKKYNKKIDLLALGYTGAGPYPQTYYDIYKEKKKLIQKSKEKKKDFINRYLNYSKYFDSRYNLPFAGKYLLGGKLTNLNKYRGVIDPIEIKKVDKKAIILADEGKGYINLKTNKISKERIKSYSHKMIKNRQRLIKNKEMVYEKDIKINPKEINFQRMIYSSYLNALKKSEVTKDYFFVFNIIHKNITLDKFIINCNKNKNYFKKITTKINRPVSELFIDYRYFFGLLTGLYHWNNAEVGSHIMTRRKPDNFDRSAQRFLNFFNCL